MGIINFIRKMRNNISAALLAFVASAQAGFLTEDYAEEGRNLSMLDVSDYECDSRIKYMRSTFCSWAITLVNIAPKVACETECDGDEFIGFANGSVINERARDEFCMMCCGGKK